MVLFTNSSLPRFHQLASALAGDLSDSIFPDHIVQPTPTKRYHQTVTPAQYELSIRTGFFFRRHREKYFSRQEIPPHPSPIKWKKPARA